MLRCYNWDKFRSQLWESCMGVSMVFWYISNLSREQFLIVYYKAAEHIFQQLCEIASSVLLCMTLDKMLTGLWKTVLVLPKLSLHTKFMKFSVDVFFAPSQFLNVLRCNFSLSDFILSAVRLLWQSTVRSFFTVNYNTRETKRQIRLMTLMRFCLDIQFRLLFAEGLTSGFLFLSVKKLCITLWFRKHRLVLFTGL
jgi:hypothetical protein